MGQQASTGSSTKTGSSRGGQAGLKFLNRASVFGFFLLVGLALSLAYFFLSHESSRWFLFLLLDM